ncbi:hypothetical protein BV25DRAFT_1813211 [Artomyces pyxidatus]|uniref:Uncharacterized protein n=1 Tax=Artomyces pyxidatus TaxID=48021 RepID=A0ACB8SLX2_9AGAM|nr:hypothetical protein BV25DRAFT_1813211 [Artomyces pyxidatus]
MKPPSPDIVSIESLYVPTIIAPNIYGHRGPQPHYVSIHFHLHPTSLLLAAATDDSRFSIRYWGFSEEVRERARAGEPWASGRALANTVTGLALAHVGEATKEVRVEVLAPKAAPRARGGMGWELVTQQDGSGQEATAFVRGLELSVVLGAETPERTTRQRVVMDVWFMEKAGAAADVDYRALVDRVVQESEASSHRTLERLVHEATRVASEGAKEHLKEVSVRAERPAAVTFAESLAVQLTRPCNG